MQAEAPGGVRPRAASRARSATLYGNGEFADACLLARRLVERGVRIVQVYYGNGQPWDDHSDITNHRDHAEKSDQPIAALLDGPEGARPARRHAGALGRRVRPHADVARAATGRDHNSRGFTMWLAGGGVKGGMAYGATDEFGFDAVENQVHVHDLHATILHLMGLDHEKLTYRYSGRDFRLTDVHGNVVKELFV